MKKTLILVAILMIAFFTTNAHCYDVGSYKKTYSISGSISTNYTDSSIQFNCGSATKFTTASNLNNWNNYYFNGKVTFDCPLNFPSGKGNIKFYGNTKAAYINMTGRDTIKADGGTFSANFIVSNNSKPGQYNVIYTNSYVTIGTTKYYPGDTFYSTPSNKETAVLITDCKGITLPIKIVSFNGRVVEKGVEIIWSVENTESVTLYYSADGIGWIDLHDVKSPFLISDDIPELFVRIGSDNEYSETLIFHRTINNEAYEVYDLHSNRLIIEPVGEVYIKYFPRLKKGEKHLIIN